MGFLALWSRPGWIFARALCWLVGLSPAFEPAVDERCNTGGEKREDFETGVSLSIICLGLG